MGAERTATIKTLEPCQILVYEGTLEELTGEQPSIIRMLIKTLANRLKQTTKELDKAEKTIKENQAKLEELEQINTELKEKLRKDTR